MNSFNQTETIVVYLFCIFCFRKIILPERIGVLFHAVLHNYDTVLVLSKLKIINATAPQPQHNVLKCFAIFKNVAHSLEPIEMPSSSASHQAPNYVQRS